MIYVIVLLNFISVLGIITFIYALKKILEQKKIKTQRIKLLENQTKAKIMSSNLSQVIYELYIETFSHYLTYIIGHFCSILLDIYSVIFSIASLSMISLSNNGISDDIIKVISLLSTFFVIILVFSRLAERSKNHFLAWIKRENMIMEIYQLLNVETRKHEFEEEIFSLILDMKNKIK